MVTWPLVTWHLRIRNHQQKYSHLNILQPFTCSSSVYFLKNCYFIIKILQESTGFIHSNTNYIIIQLFHIYILQHIFPLKCLLHILYNYWPWLYQIILNGGCATNYIYFRKLTIHDCVNISVINNRAIDQHNINLRFDTIIPVLINI